MLSILLWFAFWLESEEGHCKTSVRVISIVSARDKESFRFISKINVTVKG